MGFKKFNNFEFNWQSTNPAPFVVNTPLSGNVNGAMAGTNTIYTNIQDITNTDNQGLEISWTNTATGTITVLGSESGINFFPFTFNPPIAQPAGTAGVYGIDLNQVPWRYLMISYTNISGTGILNIWLGSKDLN
jgi:hypothetical protein